MIAFALGIVVGAFGVMLVSLCVAAGEADKHMQRKSFEASKLRSREAPKPITRVH